MEIKFLTINEQTIEKSRFICLLEKVTSPEEAQNSLIKAKELYPRASHYCYAYLIGSFERYSDDGEPSLTAGKPLHDLMRLKGLNNTICIVIRYFGGIKLGTGGLVRAYTSSLEETIKIGKFQTRITGIDCFLTLEFSETRIFDYYIKQYVSVIEISYTDKVYYRLLIKKDEFAIINEKINNRLNRSCLLKIYGEKPIFEDL